jgi:hypothetical protein
VTRLAVIALVCLAFAGFFGAKVLAGSQPGAIGLPTVTLSTSISTQISTSITSETVTVPIVTTVTSPTATVTSPTATVTSPTATVTSPTATVTSPTATVTSPTATVSATVPSSTAVTTSVATVTASGPSVPVTTSAATVATSTTSSTTTDTARVGVSGTDPSAGSTGTAQGSRIYSSAGTGATASGFLGSADGASIAATSLSTDPSRASGASALILSPGRGQRTVLLKGLRLERLPGHGKRLTVRLRFVLSGPARVTFFVFGPAPSCSVAGRFTISGHAGLNKVPFRGRIRGRLLHSGIYTIVPQATARAASLRGPRVAILIDSRGIHPTARMPWENCRSAIESGLLLPVISRHGGVAAAIAMEPAIPADTPTTGADTPMDRSREFKAWILPSAGRSWLTIAVLMALLASVTLLGLAAVEPLYARMRFPLVRAIDAHRGQVAFSGAAFFAAAGMLLLLGRLM